MAGYEYEDDISPEDDAHRIRAKYVRAGKRQRYHDLLVEFGGYKSAALLSGDTGTLFVLQSIINSIEYLIEKS